MLIPSYSKQFNKDIKRLQKRGKSWEKIKTIIKIPVNEKLLPERCQDHKLIGKYKDRRECHVEPDWVLIYKIDGSEITFERTGSHSDLFK